MVAVERELAAQKEQELKPQIGPFGLHLHAYQPIRKLVIDGKPVFDIQGWGDPERPWGWNELIWKQTYQELFLEKGPYLVWVNGGQSWLKGPILKSPFLGFDFFGSLRDWIKADHKEDWPKIVDLVQGRKEDGGVLVDPYLHPILPLLPKEDQKMLAQIGLAAFKKDFGFLPKPLGMWLPECGVTEETLGALAELGVDYVFLKDTQIKPEFRDQAVLEVDLGGNLQIAVLAANDRLGRQVAFGSVMAPDFVNAWQNLEKGGRWPSIVTDMETFGHHSGNGRWQFLYHLLAELEARRVNFSSKPEQVLKIEAEGIISGSSWSCDHDWPSNLGRWQGTCPQCEPDPKVRERKKRQYLLLKKDNQEVNQVLDQASDWRGEFINWFLGQRENLGAGREISFAGVSFGWQALFKRKLLSLIGLTSCAWFHQGKDRIELEMPKECHAAIEALT